MVSSTLGIGAFFLLVELVERGREPGGDVLAVTREAYGDDNDTDEGEEIGIAIPATMGMLGLAFIGCALVITGLPPLSGFVAKFALLTSVLNPAGAPGGSGSIPTASWALLVLLILSGLASLIAMTRAGIRAFWSEPDRAVPRISVIEMGPVAMLLLLCALQTIEAGPILRFMNVAAAGLHDPSDYVCGVLQPVAQQQTEMVGER